MQYIAIIVVGELHLLAYLMPSLIAAAFAGCLLQKAQRVD